MKKKYFKFYILYFIFLISVLGDWAQSPIPNPQSPIPNPQFKNNIFKIKKLINKKYNLIFSNF